MMSDKDERLREIFDDITEDCISCHGCIEGEECKNRIYFIEKINTLITEAVAKERMMDRIEFLECRNKELRKYNKNLENAYRALCRKVERYLKECGYPFYGRKKTELEESLWKECASAGSEKDMSINDIIKQARAEQREIDARVAEKFDGYIMGNDWGKQLAEAIRGRGEMSDLKPCPFCGKKSKLIDSLPDLKEGRIHHKVSCCQINCIGNYINLWYETEKKPSKHGTAVRKGAENNES
jgi:hypothetical protein